MEWNLITEDYKLLPEFDKVVLLYSRVDDKNYIALGSLSSVTGDGTKWKLQTNNGFSDIFQSFYDSVNQSTVDTFKPTHWCEIELP